MPPRYTLVFLNRDLLLDRLELDATAEIDHLFCDKLEPLGAHELVFGMRKHERHGNGVACGLLLHELRMNIMPFEIRLAALLQSSAARSKSPSLAAWIASM